MSIGGFQVFSAKRDLFYSQGQCYFEDSVAKLNCSERRRPKIGHVSESSDS
jgi:hypothetical protein